MSTSFSDEEFVMRRALSLAARGRGLVEPNPMVGAVLVDDRLELIAEGRHERFGGPHAEIHALRAAGERARGATLFVTLEPCCHVGKTGPCSKAVIAAGVRRVVVAMRDPAPHVAGGGIAELRAAGIDVEIGLLEPEANALNAPFVLRHERGLPWVHAKWAMTLDGRIASRARHSKWITGEASRRVVHELRGLMDAIVVGSGTARADDPLLTARPPGPRTPTRVVVDSSASLSPESRLARSSGESPVIVVCVPSAPSENVERLRASGVEVLVIAPAPVLVPIESSVPRPVDLNLLMRELCRRGMTHVLVEGGGELLGSLFDAGLVNEVHTFVAPKIVGGADAVAPVRGFGLAEIPSAPTLEAIEIRVLDGDLYVRGRTATR